MSGKEVNPTISVIIPTYNRAHLLTRAVNSLLNQTFDDLEVIIVDDCSKDDTEEIVKRISDKRVRYIKHGKNRGGSATRNTGIKAIRGKYVALLDDDDEFLPEKLEKQIAVLNNLPSNIWGGVYCGYYFITEKNGKCRKREALKQGNLKKELLCCDVFMGISSSFLFLKKVFHEIGLFDESFKRHQDLEFMIRFFRKYKLASVKEPLVKVYQHDMPINSEEYVEVKKKYLSEFNEDIHEFGLEISREIFANQWLQLAKWYAREGNIERTAYYLKKSLNYKVLPLRKYLRIPISITKGFFVKLWSC